MSNAFEELPSLTSIIADTMKTCEAYYGCLTTNEYGSTYLDPVKCKANGFDPIKATKEQEERIMLAAKRIETVAKERGLRALDEESRAAGKFFQALPKPYLKKNKEVPISGEAEPLNVMHKEVSESIEKRPKPTQSSINEAFKLIGQKIKLYDDDVEVVAVKATKDGVFLEVEEIIDGEMIHYSLDYENDVVPLTK